MDGLHEVLFRIVENDRDGRHLVALRDILPGKVIFSESPLAIGPPASQLSDDDLCIVCLKSLDHPSVCGRCFWPVCSSECGRSSGHKRECTTLSACARHSEDELLPIRHLLVLRLMLYKNRDSYAWDKLMEMEDHHGVQTYIRSLEEELSDAERIDLHQFISDSCGIGKPGDDTVDTVADIVQSSAILINCDNPLIPDFPGLFLTAGLLSHSCVPNTRLIFDSDEDAQTEGVAAAEYRMTVYSARKISKGEKLTYCSLKHLTRTGTRERRKKLIEKRLIDCSCPRCSDPTELGAFTSALLCSRCGVASSSSFSKSSPMLPTAPLNPGEGAWTCPRCNHSVRDDFAVSLVEKLQEDLESASSEEAKAQLQDFLRLNAPILHRNHFLMVQCKMALFYLKAEVGDDSSVAEKMEAAELGLELLKVTDKVEPELSRERQSLVIAVGNVLQQMLSREVCTRLNTPEDAEMTENHIYSAFHDALFCFDEAKRIQRLEKSKRGRETYAAIKSSIHLLKEMKKDFERSYAQQQQLQEEAELTALSTEKVKKAKNGNNAAGDAARKKSSSSSKSRKSSKTAT